MFLCKDAFMLCCVSDSMSVTYWQTDRATTRGPSGPKKHLVLQSQETSCKLIKLQASSFLQHTQHNCMQALWNLKILYLHITAGTLGKVAFHLLEFIIYCETWSFEDLFETTLNELDAKLKLNLLKVLQEVLPMTSVRMEEMCFVPVEKEDNFAARKLPKIR